MTTPTKRAPAGLGAPGARLWRELAADHPPQDAGQQALLAQVCRARDTEAEADELLKREGMVVKAPNGQLQAHPATRVLASARQAQLAGLRALGLASVGKRGQRPGRDYSDPEWIESFNNRRRGASANDEDEDEFSFPPTKR